MTLIGSIAEINRYPVKSFAGERLNACTIEPYGLYGDRCFAFIDETKEGWDSFVTARDIPEMLAYKAKFAGERGRDEFPPVIVTAPDGRSFGWTGDLLDDIQAYADKKISMTSYPYRPKSGELMGVDSASILLITDFNLHKLESMWGKSLDPRRFRANLIVSLNEPAIEEGQWIGRLLRAGEAELRVDLPCDRCSMITVDPDTLERDSSLLGQVNERMNLNFGVYASVIKPGRIQDGDPVELMQ